MPGRTAAGVQSASAAEERMPVARPITHGPRFHWFGYYDKLQFDPTARYVLGMESKFENRTPLADDVVTVGMVDLANDNRWTPFGESSRARCWQQGCMLQWLPGSRSEVIWNDREGDHFVSHMMYIRGRSARFQVYALSWTANRRLRRTSAGCTHPASPGYGYAGVPDRNAKVLIPNDVGIWRMSLATGQVKPRSSPSPEAATTSQQPRRLDRRRSWVQSPAVFA